MAQWIPGSTDPQVADFAAQAERELLEVLRLDSNNMMALASLASLSFNQKRLDEAAEWNRKIVAVYPNETIAYYSLGVIAWSKVNPELGAARKQMGMRPEDPGPLRNANLRLELREKFGAVIEDGIANLRKALEIRPQYDDAMAYMNLLYRERADLKDNPAEYSVDVATADQWVKQALETKRMQGGLSVVPGIPAPPGPPPPPPSQVGSQPQRIRVGGNVQAANLIRKVEAIYPPLAMQARVQGTVRYQVIIGKDGLPSNVQLVSGHPLLVLAATDAVKQYQYKPTLLNGQPVEVITQVDVNFSLAR